MKEIALSSSFCFWSSLGSTGFARKEPSPALCVMLILLLKFLSLLMLSKQEISKWKPKETGGLTMEELCAPKKFALQMHQLFVEDYMGPQSDHKRILLFHGLGSGKTCEAIRISEANLENEDKKVLVLLPASLEANFMGELLSECTGDFYLSKKERSYISKDRQSEKARKALSSAKRKIQKRYDIMSYQKFYLDSKANRVDLSKYQLLVIDEVQNILGKLWYPALMEELRKVPKKLKIVLLSATPIFDDEIEIAKTMNILKYDDDPFALQNFKQNYLRFDGPKLVTQNMDHFKNRIQGLVSYVRGSDPAGYPKVGEPQIVVCEMSKFQEESYKRYETAPKELRRKKFEYNNSIYKAERQAANLVYPNGSCGSSGEKSETAEMWKLPALKKYSCKFAKLVEKLQKDKSLAFVYSNFVNYGGANSITDALRANGFAKYGTKSSKPKFALFTGSETKEERDKIVKAFNSPKNRDGSIIQVMVGSKSISEGVTLLRVRQVHIIDPFFNSATTEQAIGRAVRFCSHKDLPENERKVRVFMYRARGQDGRKLIDDKIYDEIVEPKKIIASEFLQALKEVAVDCEIFKQSNGGGVECYRPKKHKKGEADIFVERKPTKAPRITFKKGQTTMPTDKEKLRLFLAEYSTYASRGLKVSWNTKTETKQIGQKRLKTVMEWLEANGKKPEEKVKLREMASGTLSFGTTIKKNPQEVQGKRIPRRRNPYPGCPGPRKPTLDAETGEEGCPEGDEIRLMKSGVKCCYRKKGARGTSRVSTYTVKRKITSSSIKKTPKGVLVDGKPCEEYTVAELKDYARKYGVAVSGPKAKLCERLGDTTGKVQKSK
ncbi:D6/D11-like helicase [Golden Marseillevirus]|uniref:D6/D11-like helicase n=1 Tax=Golden Marseillevirus TaxID=1720526 RepID=UPI000877AD45|nr:D6/D11-like helicase [Golden Marseillevirus]ALX27508.1 D6/D11-like helicase [Golden Marseillevirus]